MKRIDVAFSSRQGREYQVFGAISWDGGKPVVSDVTMQGNDFWHVIHHYIGI